MNKQWHDIQWLIRNRRKWLDGIRRANEGLKIPQPQGYAGSTPAPGTTWISSGFESRNSDALIGARPCQSIRSGLTTSVPFFYRALFDDALPNDLVGEIRSYLQQQKVRGRIVSARGSKPGQAASPQCDP